MRFNHGKREYTLTDGKSEFQFFTDEYVAQGGCVRIEGEMAAGGIRAGKIETLSGAGEKEVLERTKESVISSCGFPDSPILLPEAGPIWPILKKAAGEIIFARKAGRSVLIRFHGDADGIVSAFALGEVLKCKAFQQNSAVYSVKEALRDLAFIGQESRPLIILADFGSGSREGLEILRAAGVDYLVIDHHPYEDKENGAIINPLKIDKDNSKYCAGYLCCEISAMCGMDREEARAWARVACAGDKSEILRSTQADAEKAMVLDFLASHISYGNNLDFYRKVMGQEELFKSIAAQAEQSIEEAAQKAMARMKRGGTKTEVVSFALEGIAQRGEWPPSSKITTRVFDKLKGENALICIGYTERSIIMRLNDAAVSAGLGANLLAEKMKASMGDFIEGGGGHAKAGAIRVKEGFVKEVLGQLLAELS